MSERKVTHITLTRWFQKLYGNTYHVAYVYYNDGTSDESPVGYGYGEHGLHTAIELAGLAEDAYKVAPYTLFLREKGITYNIVDVQRKKDL